MTVLSSCWCWNSSRKFLECNLTWKSLKFEYLCWMADVWKRKRPRSRRCSPTSTTTATDNWATSGSVDTAYGSSGSESAESTDWWSTAWQAWWILKGPPLGVFSCHWSARSRWLASCSGKTTQHSIVRWSAEGVVRFRTTLGWSSRLVGGIRVWMSHQCSSYHLVGVYREFHILPCSRGIDRAQAGGI